MCRRRKGGRCTKGTAGMLTPEIIYILLLFIIINYHR